VSGETEFCSGDNVVLTSSSNSNNVWSNGATTQSITVSTSGTYSVTVNNAGCISLPSADQLVTVIPTPATPTITAGGPTVFCAGGSVVLTSSSATGNTWSNGATTQSITVTTSGSYTVFVTNGTCSSLNSTPKIVTVTALPATPTISAGGPITFCSGSSVVLTSSSATGNLWSNGATTQSITVTTSGTYSVTVTNGSCSSLASNGTTVTVNPLPVAPTLLTGTTGSFCAGGSTVLTSSATSGNVWSTGETTQSITVSTAGTYSVHLVNGFGCSSTLATANISSIALPAAPSLSVLSGTTVFCDGGTVEIGSSYPSGNLWSNGETTQTIVATMSGNYSVTYTNGSGCISDPSPEITVTVHPTPAAPIITVGGPTTFCSGGNVTLTSSQATGNSWSNGATTQSIVVTNPGTYSAIYVNSNGCASTTSISTSITVLPNPVTPTISANGPTAFCIGGSVLLTASSPTNIVWSTGATTQSITASTTGNYTATLTGGNGCTSTSLPISVTSSAVPPTPVITSSGSTDICIGNSVTLTSSGESNTWSTGDTTPSIVVSLAGTYTVISSVSSCPSAVSLPTIVTVNPSPAVPTIVASGPLTFCEGEDVSLFSSSTVQNTWSNSEVGQVITVSESGMYTVTTANSFGCTSTSLPTEVVVNELPLVTLNGLETMCSYVESVTLTSGLPAGGTYSGNGVNNGIFTTSVAGVGPTIITYTYQDANGCENTAQSALLVEDCAAISELNAELFNVFPNPSIGIFTFTSSDKLIHSIKVYDAMGKFIMEQKVEGSHEMLVDMTSFPNGVYQAEIQSEDLIERVSLVINR